MEGGERGLTRWTTEEDETMTLVEFASLRRVRLWKRPFWWAPTASGPPFGRRCTAKILENQAAT